MATAARSTAPYPLHTADMPSLADQVESLTRDLKSARARNAVLLRALNGEGVAHTVSSIGVTDTPNRMLLLANEIARSGRVPAVRLLRSPTGEFCGIELAVISGNGSNALQLVEELLAAGMAVVAD